MIGRHAGAPVAPARVVLASAARPVLSPFRSGSGPSRGPVRLPKRHVVGVLLLLALLSLVAGAWLTLALALLLLLGVFRGHIR